MGYDATTPGRWLTLRPGKNFGFDIHRLRQTQLGGEVSVARLSPDEPPCELGSAMKGYFILYYGTISSLPDEVINPSVRDTTRETALSQRGATGSLHTGIL